jgi:hypothetical protein
MLLQTSGACCFTLASLSLLLALQPVLQVGHNHRAPPQALRPHVVPPSDMLLLNRSQSATVSRGSRKLQV